MANVKIRFKMPETNSSSSHSIAIYSDDDPNLPKSTLKLGAKGSVTIPDHRDDFGQDWSFINDPAVKATYTISAILGMFDCRSNSYKVYKNMFEKVIKDYTGANDVKYGWVDYTKKDIDKQFRNNFPRIDHQSLGDAFDFICFSEDSMRDFIFGNQSYVVIGSESYTPISVLRKYPKNEWKVKVIFHTGFIDGDLEIYLDCTEGCSIRDNICGVLEQLHYSVSKQCWEILVGFSIYFDKDPKSLNEFTVDAKNGRVLYYSLDEIKSKFPDDYFNKSCIDENFIIAKNLTYRKLKYEIIWRDEDVQ